ncbi:MFS transporter [Actinomadura sp. 1N219]|uniref:MFS transporter n=1 Tax=Actinomadura sp. 1N219 TaxID=3375152 RepID=UPI0037BA9F6D
MRITKPDEAGAGETAAEPSHPSLWRNRDYMLLAGGQIVSMAGSQLSMVAVPLMTLALTGSAAKAGLVSTVEALPYFLFGLVAGVLVDRWNRKTIMIVCDGARALAMLSIPVAYWTGHLSFWMFVAAAFVIGTSFVFFNIAEISSLSQVVGKSQLTQAASVNEVAESSAALAGPGIGGALVALGRTPLVGGAIALLVDGITFLVSMVSLLLLRRPLNDERDKGAQESMWTQFKEGQRYVWSHPTIRTMMLLAAALNSLFSPSYLAIIVLASKDMDASATVVGLVFSVGAAGGLIGGLLSPRVAKRVRSGPLMTGALIAWALAMPLIPLSTSPWMLVGAWGLVTFVSPMFDVPQVSQRLKLVPEHLQGRVNSSFRFVAWGIRPAAIGIGGVLVAAVGAREVLWGIAAGMALVAASGVLLGLYKAR